MVPPGPASRRCSISSPDSGIPVRERNFSLVDCYGADEAFLTGTFGAQTPVGSIDGRALPHAPGPVTKRVRALYRAHVGA